jgi:hypothetical protein
MGANERLSWPSSSSPTRYSQMSYTAWETALVSGSSSPSSSRYLALRVMPHEVELATITPGSSAESRSRLTSRLA